MNDLVETTPTSDERNLAMLAHLLGMFFLHFGFIAPLIIWLMKKDESPFVAREAKEALNFQITMTIAYIIAHVTFIILIGFVFYVVVFIFNAINCIMAALAMSKGQPYRYPFALRLVS